MSGYAGAYFGYPADGASTTVDPPDARAHSTFLHSCDRHSWSALRRHSTIERVLAGQAVFVRAATDRSLFVVLDGALVVQARRAHRRPPVRFEPGDVFGELTFFDGLPRPAAVVAVEDSHLLRIRHESFDVLAAHDPAVAQHLLMDLGRAMAARLRDVAAHGG